MGKKKRQSDLGWAWKPDTSGYWRANRDLQAARKERRKRNKKVKRLKRQNPLFVAKGDAFYLSKAWLQLRRLVLETYGYKCMKCDAVDTVMQVDHIKPRSKHPELSLTFKNLQVLCIDCNQEKSNLHATDYRSDSIARDLELRIAREAAVRL